MPFVPIDKNSNEKSIMSKAKSEIVYKKTDPKYSFDELILSEKTLDELRVVVNAQKNWKKVFDEWGLGTVLKQRRNLFVNLYGKPGTGKTMAAHAIANDLNKKLICVNYADIESKYVGETSKNLSKLFSDKKNMEDIIFFDEADALLSKRVTDMSSATDVSVNQTRSVLLTLLNEYEGMVIFATNFLENYDAAFMRRIQYHIRFEMPERELRERLWTHYIPKQMPIDVDIRDISEKYDNLSGSDISTAVLKAALQAANKGLKKVTQENFENAIISIQNSKNANEAKKDNVITRTIVPEEEVPKEIRDRIKREEENKSETNDKD